MEEALGLSGWDESSDAVSDWALPTAGTAAVSSVDLRAPRAAVVQHPRCGAPHLFRLFGLGWVVWSRQRELPSGTDSKTRAGETGALQKAESCEVGGLSPDGFGTETPWQTPDTEADCLSPLPPHPPLSSRCLEVPLVTHCHKTRATSQDSAFC